MNQQAARNITRTSDVWFGRDGTAWRINVPVRGGRGKFPFTQYGGIAKALDAARKFHIAAIKLLESDRAYKAKHGELPERATLNARNTSGTNGICYDVSIHKDGSIIYIYIATWFRNHRQYSERFSTAKYKSKEDCLRRAKKKRNEMVEGKFR